MSIKYILEIKILNTEDEQINKYLREYYLSKKENLYHHQGDIGIDIIIPPTLSSDNIEVPNNYNKSSNNKPFSLNHQISTQLYKIEGTNINICSYWMIPRSSISKTPLRLANSLGLIDAGYQGPLIAKLDNVSNENYILDYKTYPSLFQLVPMTDISISAIELVEEFTNCEHFINTRNDKGFGSTN